MLVSSSGSARVCRRDRFDEFTAVVRWPTLCGARFFPATITIDDPLCADELSLRRVQPEDRHRPVSR